MPSIYGDTTFEVHKLTIILHDHLAGSIMKSVIIFPCKSILCIILCIIGWASAPAKKDMDSWLIDAYRREGKTVEVENGREPYTKAPTFAWDDRGCQMARIQGWSEANKIEEKKVGVCNKGF